MEELKPYMVGENDMVAARSSNEALTVFIAYVGWGYDEFSVEDDVQDMSAYIDMDVLGEDGKSTGTLQDYINDCNGVPRYLYGWE